MNASPMLICYKGSHGTAGVIQGVAELLGRRRAVVLHVASPITVAESLAVTYGVVLPSDAFEETIVSAAAQIADQGAALARSSGLDAEGRGELAAPTWRGIVDVADELDAPLIVVGSRGLTGVRRCSTGASRIKSPNALGGRYWSFRQQTGRARTTTDDRASLVQRRDAPTAHSEVASC